MKNKVCIMLFYSLFICTATNAKEIEKYSPAKDSESYNSISKKNENKREDDKEKNRNIKNKLKFIGSF